MNDIYKWLSIDDFKKTNVDHNTQKSDEFDFSKPFENGCKWKIVFTSWEIKEFQVYVDTRYKFRSWYPKLMEQLSELFELSIGEFKLKDIEFEKEKNIDEKLLGFSKEFSDRVNAQLSENNYKYH